MVTDRELNAMMADGLLNTVRDAAKSLYGKNQTYPCDDVKRMAAEVERLRAALEGLVELVEMQDEFNTPPTDAYVALCIARAALGGNND